VKCIDCQEDFPDERLEILQEKGWPLRCVKCSKVQPKVSFMIYGHKTAGEVIVIPNQPDGTHNPELIRQAERAFKRSR